MAPSIHQLKKDLQAHLAPVLDGFGLAVVVTRTGDADVIVFENHDADIETFSPVVIKQYDSYKPSEGHSRFHIFVESYVNVPLGDWDFYSKVASTVVPTRPYENHLNAVGEAIRQNGVLPISHRCTTDEHFAVAYQSVEKALGELPYDFTLGCDRRSGIENIKVCDPNGSEWRIAFEPAHAVFYKDDSLKEKFSISDARAIANYACGVMDEVLQLSRSCRM